MRCAWIHRFIGLLWLALCSTAVLPWAHQLAHLAEPGLESVPVRYAGYNDADAAAAITLAATGDHDDAHRTDACVVCQHLFGHQHAATAATFGVVLAAARQLGPPGAATRSDHASPGWLTPAPRAPPPHLNV